MSHPDAGKFKPGINDPDVAGRWAAALRMRTGGASYQQIADSLGYANPSGAQKAVMAALEQTVAEPADEYRKIELIRLDAVQTALWNAAIRMRRVKRDDGKEEIGDPSKHQLEVIDRLMRVMARRAKLLGLDAAEKHEHDVTSAGQPLAGVLPVLPSIGRGTLAPANGNGSNGDGHGHD